MTCRVWASTKLGRHSALRVTCQVHNIAPFSVQNLSTSSMWGVSPPKTLLQVACSITRPFLPSLWKCNVPAHSKPSPYHAYSILILFSNIWDLESCLPLCISKFCQRSIWVPHFQNPVHAPACMCKYHFLISTDNQPESLRAQAYLFVCLYSFK